MSMHIASMDELDPKSREFYCKALTTLNESGIPFLVGGTYAFERYTGIARHTKDLDLFIRSRDCDRVFEVFDATGWRTELRVPHWLGKVFCNEDFIDIIFNAAHGCDEVNVTWLERAVEETVFDIPVKLCSAEDMICSKAFIMARDRYDGADVAHLLLACSEQLDWSYLLERFGSYWRVLLSHLILFGFIYPSKRERIPDWVMQELLHRLQQEMNTAPPKEQLCRGTLLSGMQYLVDIERWGYQDARLGSKGNMTVQDVELWTAALQENH